MFKLNINTKSIVSTLKAIDSKINEVEDAYFAGAQKIEDKMVDGVVAGYTTVELCALDVAIAGIAKYPTQVEAVLDAYIHTAVVLTDVRTSILTTSVAQYRKVRVATNFKANRVAAQLSAPEMYEV